ncbi:MAG: winged helix-turn-helix transcriptional regulator [Thermoplasmatota archaeon]
MDILREKSLSTRVLILLEIATGRHSRLASIADRIGITKQAVSDYIKKMREEGLVQVIDGEYKPTIQGTQFMHRHLLDLKQFLDDTLTQLNIIESDTALAGDEITEGDTLGLFMENGILTAYSAHTSTSRGTARQDADPGEDIAIDDMEGIMQYELGTIHLFELPGPQQGGTRILDVDALAEAIDAIAPDRVAIADVIARAALHKAGIPYHIEFSPHHAAIEAVQRGLNVALLGWSTSIEEALSTIQDFNGSSVERIHYDVTSFCPKK